MLISCLDILLVAALFYKILSFLKGTKAVQVIFGMIMIFIVYVISNALGLETLSWIIDKFYSSFIVFIIVLFQDDIRRFLSNIGRKYTYFRKKIPEVPLTPLFNAVKIMSHERIGAIIVLERSVSLDKLYERSVTIDAVLSEELLVSIFQSFSPLHDGAVVINKDRIICASAHLPLSKRSTLKQKVGTRHRAGLGITEETDAVSLIISEETGRVSIAFDGMLKEVASVQDIRSFLGKIFNLEPTIWPQAAQEEESKDDLKPPPDPSELSPEERLEPDFPLKKPTIDISIGGIPLDPAARSQDDKKQKDN